MTVYIVSLINYSYNVHPSNNVCIIVVYWGLLNDGYLEVKMNFSTLCLVLLLTDEEEE